MPHVDGALDQAIADYDEAIRLEPRYAWPYVNRGHIRRHKEEYDQAIADFNEANRLEPNSADPLYGRGLTWLRMQRYDQAIADFSEVMRLMPEFASPYVGRGRARKAKQEYDRALADFDEAIRMDSKSHTAYDCRAWLWATCPDARFRDGCQAVESATRACELTRWKEASYLATLAAAYAEAGDFDSAVEWQRKAVGALPPRDDQRRKDYESRLRLFLARNPYRE
jgi:tetratricopeptide (TPR) repeat protein